jgi:hypothetical protein
MAMLCSTALPGFSCISPGVPPPIPSTAKNPLLRLELFQVFVPIPAVSIGTQLMPVASTGLREVVVLVARFGSPTMELVPVAGLGFGPPGGPRSNSVNTVSLISRRGE